MSDPKPIEEPKVVPPVMVLAMIADAKRGVAEGVAHAMADAVSIEAFTDPNTGGGFCAAYFPLRDHEAVKTLLAAGRTRVRAERDE